MEGSVNIIRVIIGIIFLIFLHPNIYSQTSSLYRSSLDSLISLLNKNGKFSEAVFVVENVFYGNTLNYEDYRNKIRHFSNFINQYGSITDSRNYKASDTRNYLINHSIFTALFDTLEIANFKNIYKLYSVPFSYSEVDPLGKKDWTNMFVTKLLISRKGNCHSLAFLYKIVADELNAKCWLALAPNHIYIRNYSKKVGWYNTELSSSSFPTDAWIAATGYVSTDAIRNGIYMDTLSNQQSISLCVLDLAKGYEFQTHNYFDGFILECCELALKYHPVNPMALLLKAETLKKIYLLQIEQKSSDTALTYEKMEKAYITLAGLSYREMPEKMYQQWLSSLVKERNKYTNKRLQGAFQSIKKIKR